MIHRSVNFLMSGDAHAAYLVVALHSLRRHYSGEIVVWAYPESMETISKICSDPRLRSKCKLWEPLYRGKNGQFVNKILMMQQIDSEMGLYLDADLIINGSIEGLFFLVKSHEFIATQFNDWTTNSKLIQNRINGIADNPGIDQSAITNLRSKPYPSVNGGVFGCYRNHHALTDWHKATMLVINTFIADEVVLHTLVARNENPIAVAGKGIWNSSPKYKSASLADKDVKIWHGHGDSFTRPSKCQKGVDLWMPEYNECVVKNIGFVREWSEAANNQNKFLKTLIPTKVEV